MPNALLNFFRQEGLPLSITRDNSKIQSRDVWINHMRKFWVKDRFIEPYSPQQNPEKREDVGIQKVKLSKAYDWYRL